MTEGVSSSSDAAAEQARLRKERREAKIKAGGSARLSRINGMMGGRVMAESDQAGPELATKTTTTTTESTATTQTTAPFMTAAAAAAAADPDEVDISSGHFHTLGARRNRSSDRLSPSSLDHPSWSPSAAEGPLPDLPPPDSAEAQLRRLMLAGGGVGDLSSGGGVEQQDALMKMMSQMMMMGGGGGGGGGVADSPFAAGSAAMPPSSQQQQQQQQQGADTDSEVVYTTTWRILHALLALGLGLYIVMLTTFDGSQRQRQQALLQLSGGDNDDDDDGGGSDLDLAFSGRQLVGTRRNFFWIFATAEALLLTTRLLLDSSRRRRRATAAGAGAGAGAPSSSPGGVVWAAASQLLPAPWRDFVLGVARYGRIVSTVRKDMLLCAFVLGVCAWWKGRL